MKRLGILAAIGAFLIIGGAGCSNSKSDEFFNGFPENGQESTNTKAFDEVQNAPETNTPSVRVQAQTPVDASNKTPRERGMVRIKVISSETKLPIAGVPLVIYSSNGTTTNNEGWAEFPQATGNVYVPPIPGNWKGSGYVNTMNGDKEGNITILLQVDKP